MCGITGFVTAKENRKLNRFQLEKMCDLITHRGPDDSGFFMAEGVGLAHRRLSIIDLSGGHQPITAADGRLTIIFNGEIYNYRELKAGLELEGYSFVTNSDTEVILYLYHAYGDKCVDKLRGMFAFAIWNADEQELFMARDRVGIKPVYYHLNGDTFVFGSELKCVMGSGVVDKSIDTQAVDDFFAYGFIRAPRSIFSGVKKLEPGHWLKVKIHDNSVQAMNRRYWELPKRQIDNHISYEDAKVELERLLLESVQVRTIAEVPLGAFLSGGIDSSTVVWLLSRVSPHRVKTFSIGFNEESHSELPFARAVAKHFDTDHEEEIVTPNAMAILSDVLHLHDEPFGDPSSIPTWYVSQVARKHVTVALSGDGGDELFAGYNRFVAIAEEDKRLQKIPMPFRKAVAGLSGVLPKERRYWNKIRRTDMPIAERYGMFRTIFHPQMRRRLFRPELLNSLDFSLTADLFSQCRHHLQVDDAISSVMASDFTLYLPCDVLTKVDRMSMAHSLESRVPILDHHVAEFAQTLPVSYLYNNGRTKNILRDIIEPHLPQEVLTHKKQGFSVPLSQWFRTDLKDLLYQALNAEVYQKSEWFNKSYVEHIFNVHQSQKANLSWHLWQLLIFSQWYHTVLPGFTA